MSSTQPRTHYFTTTSCTPVGDRLYSPANNNHPNHRSSGHHPLLLYQCHHPLKKLSGLLLLPLGIYTTPATTSNGRITKCLGGRTLCFVDYALCATKNATHASVRILASNKVVHHDHRHLLSYIPARYQLKWSRGRASNLMSTHLFPKKKRDGKSWSKNSLNSISLEKYVTLAAYAH